MVIFHSYGSLPEVMLNVKPRPVIWIPLAIIAIPGWATIHMAIKKHLPFPVRFTS